jgi:DNA-binding transcriptional MerR regulator
LNKAADAFRTISEVADELDLPQHVLRFWESRFPHIRPMKRGGGRRYYRPEDVDLLRGIRHLLYGDGYTIRGVQRILREQGVRTVQSVGQGHTVKLRALPRDDAGEDDGEPQGTRGILKFLPPLFSGAPAETEIEDHEPDEPGRDETVPLKRPAVEARSPLVPQVPKAPAAGQVAQAALPPAAPPPKGLAADDLDRLKNALGELEACRRLLDRANEGGR